MTNSTKSHGIITRGALLAAAGLSLATGALVTTPAMAATGAYGITYQASVQDNPVGNEMPTLINVAPQDAPSVGSVVYCFNVTSSTPRDGSLYTKQLGTPERFTADATAAGPTFGARGPRVSGQELSDDVLRVIWDGYGNDAAGIQAAYGLSNEEFRTVTQQAVWYFSDSDNSSYSFNSEAMNQALTNLVGLGGKATLQTPPANDTLDIYETQSTGYQNLLGSEVLDSTTKTVQHPAASVSTPSEQPSTPRCR